MKKHYETLEDILIHFPVEVGCEVGVHAGGTTKYLLDKITGIKKYYAVDPWESYLMKDGERKYRKPGHKVAKTWEQAKKLFFKNTKKHKDKIVVLNMKSIEAVKYIKDEELDWVFIDANHEYEYAKENLKIWTPKVKEGGIISGHDYDNGEKKGWGIKRAVDEYVSDMGLHLLLDHNAIWWFIK